MSDRRLAIGGGGPLVLKQERFFPAGNYTWVVPAGCTSVDVFLVGGGGGAGSSIPGGGGYTKTFKSDTHGYRDGDAISVTPGQSIQVIVGGGGTSTCIYQITSPTRGGDGEYSQFLNSSYVANGGSGGYHPNKLSGMICGSGGSGAGAPNGYPGSDGSNGTSGDRNYTAGSGQGHTTRDFGEPDGNRNAGGGGINRGATNSGGTSDYSEGSGSNSSGRADEDNGGRAYGGGGYGGGAAGSAYTLSTGPGGDGTVLIRYYAYE